jgi:hypothetical protein
MLTAIGASQWRIVAQPLGSAADAFPLSGGFRGLSRSQQTELNRALAVWVKDLRILLINESHPKLVGLGVAAREQFIAHLSWHEWGHALSVERCSPDDVAEGARLLARAPAGVREGIRAAGYRSRSYTHEIIAETYATLMGRRLRGGVGQPPWLDDEIYILLERTTEWTG